LAASRAAFGNGGGLADVFAFAARWFVDEHAVRQKRIL
jgi:hypothetical protein